MFRETFHETRGVVSLVSGDGERAVEETEGRIERKEGLRGTEGHRGEKGCRGDRGKKRKQRAVEAQRVLEEIEGR